MSFLVSSLPPVLKFSRDVMNGGSGVLIGGIRWILRVDPPKIRNTLLHQLLPFVTWIFFPQKHGRSRVLITLFFQGHGWTSPNFGRSQPTGRTWQVNDFPFWIVVHSFLGSNLVFHFISEFLVDIYMNLDSTGKKNLGEQKTRKNLENRGKYSIILGNWIAAVLGFF